MVVFLTFMFTKKKKKNCLYIAPSLNGSHTIVFFLLKIHIKPEEMIMATQSKLGKLQAIQFQLCTCMLLLVSCVVFLILPRRMGGS